MQIETKAQLLTAESKPYSFNGNEGTSHKLRFNVAGEIYVCKSSEEQVRGLEPLVGQEGTALFAVNSRKENMSLECLSFKPQKAA